MTIYPRMLSATFVTRMLVGGALLLAAGLKTHDLLTTPRQDSSMSWRTLTPEFALIAAECLLAAWLLSGRQWALARGVAIVWMIALCGVSLYKAKSGAVSCGCFGRFEVNPWITFTLDVAALVSLLSSPAAGGAMLAARREAVLIGSQIVLLGAMALIPRSPFRRPAQKGAPELDPARWVSQQPWTLGKYVENWDVISHGRWVLLLYSPDCRACTTSRDAYETLAAKWHADRSPIRVALIDTIGEPDDYNSNTPALYGLLSTPTDWEISTPTLVILNDGRVVETDQGFEQCQWNDRKFPE